MDWTGDPHPGLLVAADRPESVERWRLAECVERIVTAGIALDRASFRSGHAETRALLQVGGRDGYLVLRNTSIETTSVTWLMIGLSFELEVRHKSSSGPSSYQTVREAPSPMEVCRRIMATALSSLRAMLDPARDGTAAMAGTRRTIDAASLLAVHRGAIEKPGPTSVAPTPLGPASVTGLKAGEPGETRIWSPLLSRDDLDAVWAGRPEVVACAARRRDDDGDGVRLSISAPHANWKSPDAMSRMRLGATLPRVLLERRDGPADGSRDQGRSPL